MSAEQFNYPAARKLFKILNDFSSEQIYPGAEII
jgi:hypothetical protein